MLNHDFLINMSFCLSFVQFCLNMSLFSHVSLAQDAGLDALAAVISRQKQMGQDIGNELDEQNGK